MPAVVLDKRDATSENQSDGWHTFDLPGEFCQRPVQSIRATAAFASTRDLHFSGGRERLYLTSGYVVDETNRGWAVASSEYVSEAVFPLRLNRVERVGRDSTGSNWVQVRFAEPHGLFNSYNESVVRVYEKPILVLGTTCDLDLAKHDIGYVNEHTMRIKGSENIQAGDYLYAAPLTTAGAMLRVMGFLTPALPNARWNATCSDLGELHFRSVPACSLRVSGPLASLVGLGVNGTGLANIPTTEWVTAPPTGEASPGAVVEALQFAFDRFNIRGESTLVLSDVMGRRYDVPVVPGMYSHDTFCERLSNEASRVFGCRIRFYVDGECTMHAEGDRPFGVEWQCCAGDLARRTGFDPVPMRGRREYCAARPCGTVLPPLHAAVTLNPAGHVTVRANPPRAFFARPSRTVHGTVVCRCTSDPASSDEEGEEKKENKRDRGNKRDRVDYPHGLVAGDVVYVSASDSGTPRRALVMQAENDDATNVLRLRCSAPVTSNRLVVQPAAVGIALHSRSGFGNAMRPSVLGTDPGRIVDATDGVAVFPRPLQPDREVFFEMDTPCRVPNFVVASNGDARPFLARLALQGSEEFQCGAVELANRRLQQLRIRLLTHDGSVFPCPSWTLCVETTIADEEESQEPRSQETTG